MILCLPLYKAMVVCSLAASRKDASLSLCLSSVSASVLLQALDFIFFFLKWLRGKQGKCSSQC